METILIILLQILHWALFAYLAFGTLYIFLFATASLLPHRIKHPASKKLNRIAVLIPGYKEDSVITEAARDALKQDYPSDYFTVVVIADSFKQETLSKLRSMPIQVIEVSFDKSTKSRALNKAMAQIPDSLYDIAVVLDADNLMAPRFLLQVNEAFNAGYEAIQGHRVAKNTNTNFATLDAASEEINNSIFRKGHRVLNLSSSLIGSGMAFGYSFFKTLMSGVTAIGGFDKEIELKMLKQGIKIEYLPDALVYDEKVQKEEVFVKQRRRWLSAQLHYASYFGDALNDFFRKGNIDYLDKAKQMLLPPRILLIGLLPLMVLVSVLTNSHTVTWLWFGLLILLLLTFLFAIPRNLYTWKTLNAILSIPKGIFLMFTSLFTTRGANKQFIHTEHTSSSNTKPI